MTHDTARQPAIKQPRLRREIGVFGATMMGMGSIVGTGVFVSIGLAAGVAGPRVLVAIALASFVAICNGLSSAQLAANHPVSGGTYEYGYRWLSPRLGFTAGWMFLWAKSSSAATAALGFAGYLLHSVNADNPTVRLLVACATVAVLTAIVLTGIRRSNSANTVIVSMTLLSLSYFVLSGWRPAIARAATHLGGFSEWSAGSSFGLLQATALMFVAYTGYGRIATLGEEVKDPRRTIPRAVIATLIASMVLYLCVAFVSVALTGAESLAEITRRTVAPLTVLAEGFGGKTAANILALGAMTAMLGVVLNLLLGLSRVLLAMGRRGDMPTAVAKVSDATGAPWAATLVVATAIGSLVLLGDVKLTWSFSAFTVLVYYALTNLCAIRLEPAQRLFPIWPAYVGLGFCIFLAFWVELRVWLAGLALILAGLAWQRLMWRATTKYSADEPAG